MLYLLHKLRFSQLFKLVLYRVSVDMCVCKRMPPRGFFGEIGLCDVTCRPRPDLSISEECKLLPNMKESSVLLLFSAFLLLLTKESFPIFCSLIRTKLV